MKSILFQNKYPIVSLEVPKDETSFTTVDAIVEHLKGLIDAHPVARFIATFDHYQHTRDLQDGEIAPDIRDACNVIFCFGTKLPNPDVMAVRPRSIGVTELPDRFVINFMEAPMPPANDAMRVWVGSVRDQPAASSEEEALPCRLERSGESA